MSQNSEKLKNISIAFLCLISSIFLIMILVFFNNYIQEQKKFNQEVSKTITNVYQDYKTHLDNQAELQLELKNKSSSFVTVVNEISMIISARLMEDEKLISRAEADILVIEAINEIKNKNERIANIITIINKKFINNR